MNKFVILIFSFIAFYLVGQDGIVTRDGDTIRCKIIKDDDSYIVFKYNKNNSERVTLIPKSKVFVYKKNEVEEELFPLVVDKFRIGIHSGATFPVHQFVNYYRVDTSDIYFKNNGYNVGGDLTYFIKPKTGVGLVYNRAFSHIDYVSRVTKYMNREKMTYSYLGPIFSKRFSNTTHHTYFNMDLSIGWFRVNSSGDMSNVTYNFNANDIAAFGRLGTDFRLNKKLYLSVMGQMMYASIKRYKFSSAQTKLSQPSDYLYTDKDNFLIPSLDLGLRYHF